MFAAAVAKLRQPEVAELETPLEYWVSAQCRAPLGQSCNPRAFEIEDLHCCSSILWLLNCWADRPSLVLSKEAATTICQGKSGDG